MNTAYLKTVRHRLHLTQAQMAERTGISASHYSKVEGGFEMPSVAWLITLRQCFGGRVNLNKLLETKTTSL